MCTRREAATRLNDKGYPTVVNDDMVEIYCSKITTEKVIEVTQLLDQIGYKSNYGLRTLRIPVHLVAG